jgi:IclR family acetate operon transcriptional repressor
MRTTQGNDAVSVLDRVTLVLECFGRDDKRLGVSELARRANLPKSTVSRLVAELVEHRYLERDGTGVRLGLRLFELGELAAQPNALRTLALATLADLRDATGHTVQLMVRDGVDVVCLGVLRGPASPAPPLRVGTRRPATDLAAGVALLAHAPAEVLARARNTGRPETGPVATGVLARVRETGLAYEHDEPAGQVSGVAGVILTRTRQPLAAIAITGHASAFDADAVGQALRTALLDLERDQSTTERE